MRRAVVSFAGLAPTPRGCASAPLRTFVPCQTRMWTTRQWVRTGSLGEGLPRTAPPAEAFSAASSRPKPLSVEGQPRKLDLGTRGASSSNEQKEKRYASTSSVPNWAQDPLLESPARVWKNFETWQRGIVAGIGVAMGVGGVVYFLWDIFSSDATEQTKVVASDVLRDREMRDRAFEATKGLVQSVLRDDDAVDLLVDVVQRLLAQEGSRRSVAMFLKGIFEDHYTQEVTKHFVLTIVQDEWVKGQLLVVARDLTADLLHDDATKEALRAYLLEVTTTALKDQQLHREGGSAIRAVVQSSITPSFLSRGSSNGKASQSEKTGDKHQPTGNDTHSVQPAAGPKQQRAVPPSAPNPPAAALPTVRLSDTTALRPPPTVPDIAQELHPLADTPQKKKTD